MLDNRSKQESVSDPNRRNIIVSCFLGITAAITARLWYLQIIKGTDFSVASARNRVREITRPAPRGLIYDRYSRILLSNRLFFDLIVIPQYLQNRPKTLSIVSDLFHIPLAQIERKLLESQANPKFVPVRIKRNLSLHEVATLESNKFFLPGVDVDSAPRRDYLGNESAHLFGYLGEVTSKELDILNSQVTNYQYRVGSIIGKTGIERKYERYLRGGEGREALLVDALGRLQADSSLDISLNLSRPAQRGNDVYLTIDSDLQNVATEAFRNKNGAVCAIDPNNGEILVYLSNPNYKLAMYQDGLTMEDWQNLRSNPFKPLLDKVTGGAYPPGSTFKIIVAIAALEEGIVTPDRKFNCPGYFVLGNGRWKCWKHTGHGPVNMSSALSLSCDVYFYNVGNLVGIDRIAKWGRLFGLGERTGLDLNMELPGISPSTEWKLRTKGLPWLSGDTINASIGQGFNLCTPIQILNAFAAVGNGGTLYKPHFLKKIIDSQGKTIFEEKQTEIRQIKMNPTNLAVIKKGLHDVVEASDGTAKKARVPGFTVSGKTGTAQTSALKFTKGINPEDVAFKALDHAWFAAYSPSENPEIAVVVFSEYEGGGGGANAAPIAQQIIEGYWRKKFPEKFAKPTKMAINSPKEKEVPDNKKNEINKLEDEININHEQNESELEKINIPDELRQ
ncbi:penicillin-binding protein 2 [Silvanigrella paludirubra]|uniref:Penicillin-binding protein 2 n=1 Tax=Silvanigrella paludirubra TaxID=2499159 RepID=A0A6N6VW92_9BACT|nr:penicillin-binding protein 2 [Silvanigrella paludirubra]KAB8040344.1 penicillin-binding protein 2 [Silvanigrella paludirubra]